MLICTVTIHEHEPYFQALHSHLDENYAPVSTRCRCSMPDTQLLSAGFDNQWLGAYLNNILLIMDHPQGEINTWREQTNMAAEWNYSVMPGNMVSLYNVMIV